MNASDIINRLTDVRRSQGHVVNYVATQDAKAGSRLRWCGSWLHIRDWIHSGESRLRNANFCKQHLLCRSCAARRAAKMVGAYLAKLETLTASDPTLIPVMITLTVKNGGDLVERMAHLKKGWSSMMAACRKAKSASCRHSALEMNKVVGCIRSIEVTKGKDGWHPHMHIYALVRSYLSPFHLSAEWERFTGDSYIVHLTKCKSGLLPGLIEVLKYATKFSEMAPEDSWFIHNSLLGQRFIDASGILRGVQVPDIDMDDSSGLTGPYVDFIARWLGDGYTLRQADSMPVSLSGGGSVLVVKERVVTLSVSRPVPRGTIVGYTSKSGRRLPPSPA